MRVTFCAAEAVPFIQTGGLGDVCGSLPLALMKEKDIKVTLFLPGYKAIDRKAFGIKSIDQHLSKATLDKKVDVYFIEHDYFQRDGVYGDANHGDYPDNLERFQYYCEQVLKVIVRENIKTDILHCHDWHTGLIPVYLREHYAQNGFFKKTRSMLTIHNMAHQGVFPKSKYSKLNLSEALFTPDKLEFFNQINFLKAGIVFSDQVTTVSKQYAREILMKEFGCGLEGVLRSLRKPVIGIRNGIHTEVWNPATDSFIAKNYSADTVKSGKAANKKNLQEITNLPQRNDVPVFGFVSRLAHQKGIDLIIETMEQMLATGMQVVILGAGDKEYQKQLNNLTNKHPQQIWTEFDFDLEMAHKIYAGADWFLMPSRFEPCGLSQMVSMTYGTVPLVFKTGGLADTVIQFNDANPQGTGVVFERFTKTDFLQAVQQAVRLFQDSQKWDRLRRNGMAQDFSWDETAHEYLKAYECLLLD